MKSNLIILLILLLPGLLLPAACSRGEGTTYRKTRPLMDTLVSITVVSDSAKDADSAIESAFSAISRFGDLIDFFSEGSELSLINREAGIRPVRVSPETLDVVEKALYVSKKSDGAFDPAIGPVMKLWDFQKKIKPSDDEIKRCLPLVDYRDIAVDRGKSTVFLRKKGMMMDLGGVAKGYGADLAVESLRKSGIRGGIVAIAGDIRTFGLKADGKPWSIGIQNPRQKGESDEIIARLGLSEKAISTSGDYQRYFVMDGRRYHHLLNPATGYPAEGCRSVTVIADSGVYTDSFATAVFVLGPDRGMKLLEETGMDGVIVEENGTIRTTAGLKGRLKIEKDL